MAKRHRITFLLFIGTCLGCQVRAPRPSEAVLFRDPTPSRIWVIDAVTEFPTGDDQHASVLLMQDLGGEQPLLNGYLSVWQSSAPSFRYSVTSGPGQAGHKRGRWPIQARMSLDSAVTGLTWDWSRSALWLQGVCTDPASPQTAHPWFLKSQYPRQREFTVEAVSPDLGVFSVCPWVGRSKSHDFSHHGTTRWRIGIFDQPDAVFDKRPGACVAWMSIGFSDGRSMQAFLQVDAQGWARPSGVRIWAGQAPQAANGTHVPVYVPETAVWKSPRTGIAYPLEWALDADLNFCDSHDAAAVWRVRPRHLNQEIPMKRSSFWMGAIEARSGASDTIAAKGNLFVLVR